MAGTWAAGNPTGLAVKRMGPLGTGFGTVTATGTLFAGKVTVRIPWSTSTANAAGAAWINPEDGTVIARALLVFTTAGTGTFTMGRTDDGTGSVGNLISVGTLTTGVHYYGTVLGTVAGSATAGGIDGEWLLVGPGGTGTNNSITVTHSNASGSGRGYLIVEYMRVEP